MKLSETERTEFLIKISCGNRHRSDAKVYDFFNNVHLERKPIVQIHNVQGS